MKTPVITPLLAILLLTSAAAAQTYERKIDRRFETTPRPKVTLDSRFGAIRVTGSDNNTVTINALIRVKDESQEEAKRVAENVRLDISGSKEDVRLTSRLNDDDRGSHRSVEITVTVTVPREARVSVGNKFGSITIKGVRGEVRSDNQFGAVEVTNCGNVTIDNSFGNTVLGAIGGTMNISGKNGNIRAYDVPGGSITNAFGAIDVSNARGAVQVKSKMGEVHLRGIPGGAIHNEYGRIAVELAKNYSGTIAAETSFGDIDTDLNLEVQRNGTRSSCKGRIGSGSGSLVVTNKFGAIAIDHR